jgi:hypothetical protein
VRRRNSASRWADGVVLSVVSPAGPPMPTEGITAGVSGGSNVAIGNDSPLRPGGEAALNHASRMTAMLLQVRRCLANSVPGLVHASPSRLLPSNIATATPSFAATSLSAMPRQYVITNGSLQQCSILRPESSIAFVELQWLFVWILFFIATLDPDAPSSSIARAVSGSVVWLAGQAHLSISLRVHPTSRSARPRRPS